MTTSPRGAADLVASQAIPESTVNENTRFTEAGACHFPVVNITTTSPPGSCTDGANYIIAATASGLWTGKEKSIATALGTNAANGWVYHVPIEGFTAYNQATNLRYLYDGSAWGIDTSGGSFTTASTTEVLTGTDSAKGATPDAIASLWEQGADVASSGTVSLGEGGYFNITGTTTITDIDFATDKAGRRAWVKFAGILTLTYNGSTLILPTGASITTAAGDTAEFVSEGSDVVRCVAYTRASGAPLAGGASGSVWNLQWGPLDNEPPPSNYATLDSRNDRPLLAFDTTTQEGAVFSGVLPTDYSGAGVTVYIWCALATATTGTVGWDVAFERGDASSLDIDADSFGSATTVTAVTVPGTSGQFLKMSINVSNGSNMDSLAAGELFRLRVRRDVANDTATGDAQILRVMLVSQ